MRYRSLGSTGLKVSEISLGCEGFLNKDQAFTDELISKALAAGVNCMDFYSPDPDMHRRVSKALGPKLNDFILQCHLCTTWENGQYKATRNLAKVKSSFESMFKNFGRGYFDIGMIHYVDSLDTWEQIVNGGILEYAEDLKKAGKIGHIGLSSHNPEVALRAISTGKIEVLMFSVNPCYDLLPAGENVEDLWAENSYKNNLVNLDPLREKLYETCQASGVGITVMKAFGGGDLLSEYSPAGSALTAVQCLHYALTRPAVSCIMSGVRSAEDLAASLHYEEASDEEKDYASAFSSFKKISWEGHCMYCGHCAPCAKKINIADVTKFLNLALSQNQVPETVREHYNALSAHAGDCIECGLCETRCPFGVPIIENMHEAVRVFGK